MENKKPLMMRYFKEGDNKKIITTIKRKIYFSKDQNITPGYYVGTIIKECDNYGVFDTIPISKVSPDIWISNQVACAFVKIDKRNNRIGIFLGKAPENRKDEQPIKIIELSNMEAKRLWGDDYKENMVSRKSGVKKINTAGYTPFEKLKDIIAKANK